MDPSQYSNYNHNAVVPMHYHQQNPQRSPPRQHGWSTNALALHRRLLDQEMFTNLEYQKQCLGQLFFGIKPAYDAQANRHILADMVHKLVTTRGCHRPLPSPEHVSPIIRFNSEGVAYFDLYEQMCSEKSWAGDDLTQWVKHVDHEVLDYSMAIYGLMYEEYVRIEANKQMQRAGTSDFQNNLSHHGQNFYTKDDESNFTVYESEALKIREAFIKARNKRQAMRSDMTSVAPDQSASGMVRKQKFSTSNESANKTSTDAPVSSRTRFSSSSGRRRQFPLDNNDKEDVGKEMIEVSRASSSAHKVSCALSSKPKSVGKKAGGQPAAQQRSKSVPSDVVASNREKTATGTAHSKTPSKTPAKV